MYSRFVTLVGLSGLEPETSSLSVTRSNQLSYSPRTARWAVSVDAEGTVVSETKNWLTLSSYKVTEVFYRNLLQNSTVSNL